MFELAAKKALNYYKQKADSNFHKFKTAEELHQYHESLSKKAEKIFYETNVKGSKDLQDMYAELLEKVCTELDKFSLKFCMKLHFSDWF